MTNSPQASSTPPKDDTTSIPTAALRLPVLTALVLVLVGGVLLLERAERQARDTTRKHHIEDIERSLYFARATHGTLPPYDAPTWCGRLDDPKHAAVRGQIEAALRARIEKYANPAKPFPADPAGDPAGYFYWKRSPSTFELYAVLENDDTNERTSSGCPGEAVFTYDYGIASIWREPGARGPETASL